MELGEQDIKQLLQKSLDPVRAKPDKGDTTMSTHLLEEILHPQSIAVVGATGATKDVPFVSPLLEQGFKGKIYPVNPKYPEILGLKCYPNVKDIPGSVDYVISCLSAALVPTLIEDCSQKGVKGIHVYTGRFSETGRREAAELEQEVLKRARKFGIRLIGPNCMGVYYPREGISFAYEFPKEPGSVGVASQSGGGITFFIHLSSLRGIRFSKVISYGNGLDLNECDYLEYFSQDPETKIILMYIEGVRDGKRFFDLLSKTTATKPVVILKGGRGESGSRAVVSHTASLGGSMKVWEALLTQAGAIAARDFDELADLAVSFYFPPPIQGPRVGIFGGGGGPSVLAADACEEAGLDVIPMPAEVQEELKSRDNPMWDWIGNPADISILGGSISNVELFDMMAKNKNFDLLIGFLNEDAPRRGEAMVLRHENDAKCYIEVKQKTSTPILVVVGEKSLSSESRNDIRWKAVSEVRTSLMAAKIPVYPTVARAATAASKLVSYYQKRR
ncbi:acetate--CoA ligase family protein [Chloroflexota bacterium]